MEIDSNIKGEMDLSPHSPTATEKCDHAPITTTWGTYKLIPRSHRIEHVVDALIEALEQPRENWSEARANALVTLENFFRHLAQLDRIDEERFLVSSTDLQDYYGSPQHMHDFPGFGQDLHKDPGDGGGRVGDRIIKALDDLFFSSNLSAHIISRSYTEPSKSNGGAFVVEHGQTGSPFATLEYSLRDGEADPIFRRETRVVKAARIMSTCIHEMAHILVGLFWCPKCTIDDVAANIGTKGASGHGPSWAAAITALQAECKRVFCSKNGCLAPEVTRKALRLLPGDPRIADRLMPSLRANSYVNGIEDGHLSLMLQRMEEFLLLMRDLDLLKEAKDQMGETTEWKPMDNLLEFSSDNDPITHMSGDEIIARIRFDTKYLHYFTFVGSWGKIIERVKTRDMSLKKRFIDFMVDLDLVQEVADIAKMALGLPERPENMETMTEGQLQEAMAQIILDLLDRNGMVFRIEKLLRSNSVPSKKRIGQTIISNGRLVSVSEPEDYDWNERFQKIFAAYIPVVISD